MILASPEAAFMVASLRASQCQPRLLPAMFLIVSSRARLIGNCFALFLFFLFFPFFRSACTPPSWFGKQGFVRPTGCLARDPTLGRRKLRRE